MTSLRLPAAAAGAWAGMLVCVLLALPAAASATTVTVDFDDRSNNEVLSSQYQAIGVQSFTHSAQLTAATRSCPTQRVSNARPGGVNPPSLPYYWASGQSGPSEFPDFDACVTLVEGSPFVSWYQSRATTVSYRRTDGVVVSGISKAAGAQTISLGGGQEIKEVHFSAGVLNDLYLDDLSYDTSLVPPPEWSVAADPTLGVRVGTTTDQALRVRHRFGDTSSTTYAFVAGTLPAGVTGSFVPASLPSSGGDQVTQVRLTAAPTAAPGPFTYQVKVTPGAGSPKTITVESRVVPAVEVQFHSTTASGATAAEASGASALNCDQNPESVGLRVPPAAQPGPSSATLALSTSGVTGGTVTVPGAQTVALPADGSTVFVPVPVAYGPLAAGFAGKLTAGVTVATPASGAVQTTITSPLKAFGASIDDVVELDGGPSETPRVSAPRWGQPGKLLRIRGIRFCPDSKVQIGVSDPVPFASLSPDHREATVRIPADATPAWGQYVKALAPDLLGKIAPLKIIAPNGVETAGKPASFQLPRASSLFSFKNSSISNGIGWARWVEAYGSGQLEIDVDPCGWLTLGAVDCSITKVADPFQYAVWGIGYGDMGEKGLCFGHVMLSDFLDYGRVSRSGLAAPGRGAYSNFAMVDTMTPAVQHEIERRFVLQAAPEWQYRMSQARQPTFDGLVSALKSGFAEGRDPWLSIRQGDSGHIVRASDLAQPSANVAVIDVLDSNVPYLADEAVSADFHKKSMNLSRITITRRANGRYDFDAPGLGWKNNSEGDKDGMSVVRSSQVPGAYTSPLKVSGLAANLWIAAATPGTSGAELVDADGKPVPGAVSVPRAGGLGDPDGADLTVSSAKPVFLKATARSGATIGQVVQGKGVTAALQGAPGAGKGQQLGIGSGGVVSAPAGTGKPRTLVLTRKLGSERRMAKLTGPAKLETAAAVTPAGVDVTVAGGSGQLGVTLTRVAGKVAPPPVDLGTVAVGAGDRVRVPSAAFRAKAGTRVKLRVTRRGKRRTITAKVRAGKQAIRALTGSASPTRVRATARLAKLDDAASGVLTWDVRRGKRKVAAGRALMTAGALKLDAKPKVRLRKGDTVRLVAVIRKGDGASSFRRRTVKVK